MLVEYENSRVILRLPEFQEIVNSKYPELKTVKEPELLIGITHDTLIRYLSSEEKVKKIKSETALNLINYLKVFPEDILVMNGITSNEHVTKASCADEDEIMANEVLDIIELQFSDLVADVVKQNCSSLLAVDANKDSVSHALQKFSAYMYFIVRNNPKMKIRTNYIISTITEVWRKSKLIHTDISNDYWAHLKEDMAQIGALACVSPQAKKEADNIVNYIIQSRLGDDNEQKLQAAKLALHFIDDYWNDIYAEDETYSAFKTICSIMSGPSIKYGLRKRIVDEINDFYYWLSICDV